MRKRWILYLYYYYYWTLKNLDNDRCITIIWDNELPPNRGKIKSNCSHDKDFYITHAAYFSPSIWQAMIEVHVNLNLIWRWTWRRRPKCISRQKWNNLGILLQNNWYFDQSMPDFWVSCFSCWKLFRELFHHHFLAMNIRQTDTKEDRTNGYPSTNS